MGDELKRLLAPFACALAVLVGCGESSSGPSPADAGGFPDAQARMSDAAAGPDATSADAASAAARTVLLVGLGNGDLVTLDRATFAELSRTRTGDFPSFAAARADGSHLYVVHERAAEIADVEVAPSGVARVVSRWPTPAGPTHVSLDVAERFAFVASYTAGAVSVFPVASSGELGASVSTSAAGARAHAAVAVPGFAGNVEGRTRSLRPESLDAVANDSPDNWCITTGGAFVTSPEGRGNFGTPGAANPACPAAVTPSAAGALVITELLWNPSDGLAEYLEIYNPHETQPLNLRGCRLSDSADVVLDGDSPRTHTIGEDLIVRPHTYLVIASSSERARVGFDVLYDYADAFALDGGESPSIACGTTIIDTVDYAGAGFPATTTNSTWSLDPDSAFDHVANDTGSNWCRPPTLETYVVGTMTLFGTPAEENECF